GRRGDFEQTVPGSGHDPPDVMAHRAGELADAGVGAGRQLVDQGGRAERGILDVARYVVVDAREVSLSDELIGEVTARFTEAARVIASDLEVVVVPTIALVEERAVQELRNARVRVLAVAAEHVAGRVDRAGNGPERRRRQLHLEADVALDGLAVAP